VSVFDAFVRGLIQFGLLDMIEVCVLALVGNEMGVHIDARKQVLEGEEWGGGNARGSWELPVSIPSGGTVFAG